VGVRDGLPLLADGRALDVANVVWCTGYHADFSWIDLPAFGEEGPVHERGVVAGAPGLYFVGLTFLYAFSSATIHGAGRDADYIAAAIGARVRAARRRWAPSRGGARKLNRCARHVRRAGAHLESFGKLPLRTGSRMLRPLRKARC
jgi:putative flavoprotein involved in K+ transport